jgi:polyphosphate kinase 2 (PPK2 family)
VLWKEYTKYKEAIFENAQEHAPWKIIKANRKTNASINAIEYILKKVPYKVKDKETVRHKSLRSFINE